MNKTEIKDLLPILQAFAEGKAIQYKDYKMDGSFEWVNLKNNEEYDWYGEYRIKPKSKYRPFKDKEECWAEMLKHQPFGWVKFQDDRLLIVHIDDKSIGYGSARGAIIHSKFDDTLKSSTFADGTPFGILEEE